MRLIDIFNACRDGDLISLINNTQTITQSRRTSKVQEKLQQLSSYCFVEEYGNKVTLLQIACQNGHLNIVQYLIGNLGFLNSSHRNQIALYFACQKGHLDIAKYLFERYTVYDLGSFAEPSEKFLYKHMLTFFYGALESGKLLLINEIKHYMEKFGLAVNTPFHDGSTLLHEACRKNHSLVVEKLIENGANPNICDKNKTLPIDHLLDIGNLELARKLFIKMEDYSVANLHLFAFQRSRYKAVLALIEQGLKIDEGDQWGATILHYACFSDIELVKWVVEALKANVNIKDIKGHPPLYCAIKKGDPKIIKYLLEKGADINVINAQQQPLLEHLIVEIDKNELGEILLQSKKTDIFIQTSDGNYLLYKAVQLGLKKLSFLIATEMVKKAQKKNQAAREKIHHIINACNKLADHATDEQLDCMVTVVGCLLTTPIRNSDFPNGLVLIEKILKKPFIKSHSNHMDLTKIILKTAEFSPNKAIIFIQEILKHDDLKVIGLEILEAITRIKSMPCEDLLKQLSREYSNKGEAYLIEYDRRAIELIEKIGDNLKRWEQFEETNTSSEPPSVPLKRSIREETEGAPKRLKSDEIQKNQGINFPTISPELIKNVTIEKCIPGLSSNLPKKRSEDEKIVFYSEKKEIAYKIDHEAEKIVNEVLKNKFLQKKNVSVETHQLDFFKVKYTSKKGHKVESTMKWHNAAAKTLEDDSGMPYDISITKENTYIDGSKVIKERSVKVKGTVSKDPSDTKFPARELDEMRRKRKDYLLFKINIYEEDGQPKIKVRRFKDPLKETVRENNDILSGFMTFNI